MSEYLPGRFLQWVVRACVGLPIRLSVPFMWLGVSYGTKKLLSVYTGGWEPRDL